MKITRSHLRDIISKILNEEYDLYERIGTSAGKKIGGRLRGAFDDTFGKKDDEKVDKVDVSSASGDAAANAETEFQKWGGTKETDPKMNDVLTAYWNNVGADPERYISQKQPWSAAFISWALQNEPGFKKSSSHSSYMRAAKKARDSDSKSGFVAYKPEELQGGPERGDIVCKPRGTGDGWDNIGSKNHCDVYIGGGSMIGGNLSNTSKKVSYSPDKATMVIKKLAENKLKDIIIDVMLEEDDLFERIGTSAGKNEEIISDGEIIDFSQYKNIKDPEQEWYDLLDPKERERFHKTSKSIQSRKSQDSDWLTMSDEEFESYLQGVESGKIIDMFSDEDPMSEQKGSGSVTAYPGEVGVGMKVPASTDAGASANQCQIMRDEIENTTHQLHNTSPGDPAYKTLQDNLRLLQQNHDKLCGS